MSSPFAQAAEPLKLKHGDYLFFFGELTVDVAR